MYEVIIVGGGHAGVEAAIGSARMNRKTALFTMNTDRIATMPCNPAIGGPAKGSLLERLRHLVGLWVKLQIKQRYSLEC